MEREHTCCVTGHRVIPEARIAYVHERLTEEVMTAISMGYTHFISGFAAGTDLVFADIIGKLKRDYPIRLEAAIPYRNRLGTPDMIFQKLIMECDVVKVHSEHYFKGCYMVRNKYMVDHSSLVLAVYDGRKTGGTAATIRYAQRNGGEVTIIWV